MKIIYGFSGSSNDVYNKTIGTKAFNPALKYHKLLMEGFASNYVDVTCFSGLTINKDVYKKTFVSFKDDFENGVRYHYFKTLNIPFLRQFMLFFSSFFRVFKIKNKRKDTIIIGDCLNIAIGLGMTCAAKLKRIPIVQVVTDLPVLMYKNKINLHFCHKILKKSDGYIFLTEKMNERINFKSKPYIVLEGHCDCNLSSVDKNELYEIKNNKKIIIYAGSIKKIYGIEELVEGFIKCNFDDVELHIYGNGDYLEKLNEICNYNKKIKYMGVKMNEDVVYEEQRVSLLINPRPISPEYTKYSFPSKIIEYMVSGTPVLCTSLPGVPEEYFKYIYRINEDNATGISNALCYFFNISFEERYLKGQSARKFVVQNKSNVIQSKKIIEFLNDSFLK